KENPLSIVVDPTSKNKPLSPKEFNQDIFQDSFSDLATFIDGAFKEKEDGARSQVLSPKRKEVQEDIIEDILQREKETLLEVDGEKSLPSPLKSTPKASTRKR
uniref:Uncharacterized protein n=1 Tax=Cucumis melo TaxID=3656 RepID=A0A9I9D5N1_CUCME